MSVVERPADGPDAELTAAIRDFLDYLDERGIRLTPVNPRLDEPYVSGVVNSYLTDRAVLARPAAGRDLTPEDVEHWAGLALRAGGKVQHYLAAASALTRIARPTDDTAVPQSAAELPATLRTVEDVAAVCEAAELERMTGEDVHPNAWIDDARSVGVAVSGIGSTMTGIHVQRVVRSGGIGDAQQLAKVEPYVGTGALLLAAIRAAQGGDR